MPPESDQDVSSAESIGPPKGEFIAPVEVADVDERVATVGVLPTVGSLLVGGKPTVKRALTVATRWG
jgi:hypothetical protein